MFRSSSLVAKRRDHGARRERLEAELRAEARRARRGNARNPCPRARRSRNACRRRNRRARRRRTTACRATGSTATRSALGLRRPHRLLDRAVEAVVVDEIAVAVLARLLEPGQRADQFVVAAPDGDRRVRAEPSYLMIDLGAHLGEEIRRRRIEVAGEHEVLPDQQAELVAEIVEEILFVEAAAPHADHVHVGVGRGAASSLRVSSGVARDGSASAGIQLAPRQKISRPLTRKAKRAPASSSSVKSSSRAQPDAAAHHVAVACDLQRIQRLRAGAGRPPELRVDRW